MAGISYMKSITYISFQRNIEKIKDFFMENDDPVSDILSWEKEEQHVYIKLLAD